MHETARPADTAMSATAAGPAASTVLRVAVLVAAHNRVATTMAGLTRLASLAEKLTGEATFSVFLVDDCSTDGTAARVRDIPMDITVTRGTGELYWTRGMILSHRTARASGRAFDAYLLYNDDVLLDDRFLDFTRQYRRLQGAILVGALCDPVTEAVTYSGVRRVPHKTRLIFARIEPSASLSPVDTFDGNLVMIPAPVFDDLGGLDPAYAHYIGDYDLGLRAAARGVPSLLFGSPVGYCTRSVEHFDRVRRAGFRERWRLLFCYPHHVGPRIRYVRRHAPPGRFPVFAFTVVKVRVELLLPLPPLLRKVKRKFTRVVTAPFR